MSAAALLDFDAHPAALTDLDQLPRGMQEAAVHHLLNCQQRGPVLGRRGLWDLTGCRRIYLDRDRCWRLVYQERPPRLASASGGEIYLVAAGARSGHQVYNTAARRLQLLAATPAS
ncbi:MULTISPECIES: hypothetical protein [unclassified Kitasatospora]|uniref:hypothetical protein n=1 Tax=unclassified Kitasatospora TaxID=2633591 RepID=UPI000708FBC0|nr:MULTISPECIES: hypothetical protein [unclassified Kitasatospora]KQV20926.1 hypothetical protein ASC99_20700 [Kitasatospora sp. Root107]KRB60420.1 hypothetical protein ASE03_12480 [Kitasatospora sp. Root187]